MSKQKLPTEIRPKPVQAEDLEVRFYRPSQVARITNASRTEVHRWIVSGRLRAVRPEGSCSWYIPVAALDEFMSGEAA